jgi:ubiquinone/menaquinone biosynthesis C-methylase UbiE
MTAAAVEPRLTRKPYLGIQMEGPIARWYARNTGHDTRRFIDTANQISGRLPAGSAVLEVAPGPGYLAVELARRGYVVTGLDISRTFVNIATQNAQRAGVSADFRHGDVANMPFASESFDYVVCVAAFKNFPDPVAALNEIHRVLNAGRTASILDMRKDAAADDIEHEVRGMHLSPVNTWLMRLIFRHVLLRAAYTRQGLGLVVQRSRFGRGEIRPDGVGFELKLMKDEVQT